MTIPLSPLHPAYAIEANDNARRRVCPKKGNQKVSGLRLGCKPFQAAIKIFLEEIKGSIGESTWKEVRKRLNFMNRKFEELYKKGEIGTLDPRHMIGKDVLSFMKMLRDENKDPSTQKKYLSDLKKMLEYFDNFVFAELKRKKLLNMPKQPTKGIRTFSEEDFWVIFDATKDLENEWHGQMMRGAFALYWGTMRRPSEIRRCRLRDLDLSGKILHIEYPKGAGNWAGPVDVAIVRSDMLPLIRQYLVDRKEHLKKNDAIESEALFPNIVAGPNSTYSMSNFNEIKRHVEKIAGIKFTIKEFRSSSSTDVLDKDQSYLPMISAQLGHKYMATTQDHYARVRQGRAGIQIREMLDELSNGRTNVQNNANRSPKSDAIEAKASVIPKKYDISGYN